MHFRKKLCNLLGALMGMTLFTTSATATQQENSKMITVEAYDAETQAALENFVLDFSSCGFKIYESDAAGRFSMKAPESFACYVQISKPGYSRMDLLIESKGIDGLEKTFTVYLTKSANVHHAQIRDASKQNLYIPDASIMLKSLGDGTVQKKSSEKGGHFELLLHPGQRYVLEVSHPDYAIYRTYVEANQMKEFSLSDVFLDPLEKSAPVRSKWSGGKIRDHRKDRGLQHYSIQVGATSSAEVDLSPYKEALGQFGDVYVQKSDYLHRIKVGHYYKRSDAEEQLSKVRRLEAYKDAYITQAIRLKENTSASEQPKSPAHKRVETDLMIRLASYLNPSFFKSDKVDHLGEVKFIAKNEWRIAVIDGFANREEAESALEEVRNLGYSNAHLVQLEEGELRQIK